MKRIYLIIFIALSMLLFSFYLVRVQAQDESTITNVVEERHVIVTPVPTAKETIEVPTGYVSCFKITAGWYHDEWVPEHQVCQYENMTEGVAWIDGYWACNASTADGVCSNWEWKPAHWEKTVEVY